MASRYHVGRSDCIGLALLFVLSISSFMFPSASAEYSILLDESGVNVAISADFAQGVPNKYSNVTRTFTDIPVFAFRLEGDNSSLLAGPLNEAIRAKDPSATATQVQFAASSNGTWMHYDLKFHVEGSTITGQGVMKTNLAWRSLVIATDVVVASYSINRLLPTYLGSEVIGLTEEPSGVPVQQRRSWYFNGRFRSGPQIVATVPSMILFNFTSLARPLEDWVSARSLDRVTTTWRQLAGFNLTFIGRLEDPEAVLVFARTAIYNVETVIEAPGFAQASGDLIISESVGSYGAMIMGYIILVTGFVLIGTLVFESRYHGSDRRFKRGKR